MVINIGCGWGWHWDGINSPNILCMDFSFDNLQIAKKLLDGQVDRNIHFICADAIRLPVRDKVISGLWSVQTYQHLPPPSLDMAMEEAKRVLCRANPNIYWLNYNQIIRVVYSIFEKQYYKEGNESIGFYLKRLNAKELKNLIERYFINRNINTGYKELIFNPDMRITHSSDLTLIDGLLGKVPVLNNLLARQIFIAVREQT